MDDFHARSAGASDAGTSEFRRTAILTGARGASTFNRCAAKTIDALVVLTVFFVGKALWFPLGLFAALGLCALGDGFGIGQSIGKKIFSIKVVDDASGLPCTFTQSAIRNVPFLLALFLATVPFLWVFFVLAAMPLVGVEIYLLFQLESGTRLGDVLGNTVVTEAEVATLGM